MIATVLYDRPQPWIRPIACIGANRQLVASAHKHGEQLRLTAAPILNSTTL